MRHNYHNCTPLFNSWKSQAIPGLIILKQWWVPSNQHSNGITQWRTGTCYLKRREKYATYAGERAPPTAHEGAGTYGSGREFVLLLLSNSDESQATSTPMGSLNEEQVHAILREERNMRHTLEKERHRLLMRERELMAQVGCLCNGSLNKCVGKNDAHWHEVWKLLGRSGRFYDSFYINSKRNERNIQIKSMQMI